MLITLKLVNYDNDRIAIHDKDVNHANDKVGIHDNAK